MSIKKVKYGTKNLEKDLEKDFGELTFSNMLFSHRLGEEWSQKEMADVLGISTQSLCDLEKGRRIPTPIRASKIAKKLGVPEKIFIQLALTAKLKKENLDYKVELKTA